MQYVKPAIMFSLALAFLPLASCAEARQAQAGTDTAEIETIVRQYILENPEIIREALILLEEKENQQSIIAVAQELRHDPRDFSIGPKNAKVTMVEFFDYNCSFCRKSTPWVQEIIDAYPKDVRVIFKELPILDRRTQTSRLAAKAALAAHKQGKYLEMHFALMEKNGLSREIITTIAKDVGLNMTQFVLDLNNGEIEEQIEDTLELASRIPGLTGTPFFVINNQFVAGGNRALLQSMIEEELAN